MIGRVLQARVTHYSARRDKADQREEKSRVSLVAYKNSVCLHVVWHRKGKVCQNNAVWSADVSVNVLRMFLLLAESGAKLSSCSCATVSLTRRSGA
jgi:hypothetical protein